MTDGRAVGVGGKSRHCIGREVEHLPRREPEERAKHRSVRVPERNSNLLEPSPSGPGRSARGELL